MNHIYNWTEEKKNPQRKPINLLVEVVPFTARSYAGWAWIFFTSRSFVSRLLIAVDAGGGGLKAPDSALTELNFESWISKSETQAYLLQLSNCVWKLS